MVLTRVGLTGASGMLGRHLVAALRAEGMEILTVGRREVAEDAVWNLEDWRSADQFDLAFRGAQAVVHAAAAVHTDPANEAEMFDVNVRATTNLGAWAMMRRVPLVFISTAAVYAHPGADRLSEDATLGWSGLGGFYALTKLLAEDALGRLTAHGLQRAVVRPSSLYGAGLPAGKMVSAFLKTARAGGTIAVAAPADDGVDMIHAGDVARAVVAILRADAWDVFNVATGSVVSIRDVATACVEAAGRGAVACADLTPAIRSPAIRFRLDTSRARAVLDWAPVINLRTGLSMMLEGRLT